MQLTPDSMRAITALLSPPPMPQQQSFHKRYSFATISEHFVRSSSKLDAFQFMLDYFVKTYPELTVGPGLKLDGYRWSVDLNTKEIAFELVISVKEEKAPETAAQEQPPQNPPENSA